MNNEQKMKRKIGLELTGVGNLSKMLAIQTFTNLQYDVTPEQFSVLSVLIENEELYQRQISALTLKDRANVSRIVSILENKGYISKTESVSGRKTFKISITDEGRKVYEQVKPTILKIWSYTCKDIPEEKVDAFFEILSEIKKNAARHSLGFYHSNVLPLIYSYLVGYGLLTGIFRKKHYFILLTVDLVIYCFCGSRNSLFTTFLLVLGKWFIDSVIETGRFKKKINRIVGFEAKLIVPLLTAFSVFIPLMLDKVAFFRMLDYMLSYRFTYIANMIQNLGISLIPKMSNKAYFGNEIVIDNGYAFLIIRYGVLMIIFLSILIYCVAKKYKNNTFVLFLIIVVACSNLIDNDLIDYSVLPYLIISEKCLIEGLRRRSAYGRSHKCNNEYLQ